MSSFLPYLISHLYSIPYYVIWLGGIVYAVVYRHKHPRTSLLAGIALGLLFMQSLTSAILSSYLQYQAINGHTSAAEMGQRWSVLSLCSIPIGMVSWVLLLVAMFGWKNLTESESPNKDIP